MSRKLKASATRAWSGGPLYNVPKPGEKDFIGPVKIQNNLSILPLGKGMQPDDPSLDKLRIAPEKPAIIKPRFPTPWDSF